jgi:hypothetical protein
VEQDDPTLKNRIRILSITAKRYDDLGEWYKALNDDKKKWLRSQNEAYGKRHKPDDKEAAPTGAGFVFTLQGRHFHSDPNDIGMTKVPYVANTFLKNLQSWEVPQLSVTTRGPTGEMIPVRKMGIRYATIADSRPTISVLYYKNGPAAAGAARAAGAGDGSGSPMPGAMAPPGVKSRGNKAGAKTKSNKSAKVDPAISDESQPIPLTDFVVEFVWKDVPEAEQEAADPNPVKAAPPASGAAPAGQPLAAGPNAAPANPAGTPGAGTPGAVANPPQAPAGNLPGAGGPPTAGASPAQPPLGAGPPAGQKPN